MPDHVSSLVHQTLLGDALEHAAVAAAVFSDDGRYLACNGAFCALTGYTREEITSMRVGVDLALDADRNTSIFREIVKSGNVVSSGGIRRKDGSAVEVSVWSIPSTAAGLPYYVVLYWDAASGPSPFEL